MKNIIKNIKDIFRKISLKAVKVIKDNIVLAIIIAVVIVAIIVVSVYSAYFKGGTKILTTQSASQKAIDYINNNILKGQSTVSLKGVPQEVSGLYKFTITFVEQNQDSDAYITKDGKYLFPVMQGFPIDLDEKITTNSEESSRTTVGSFSITKNEICKDNGKPIVYFFGSKSCPHCAWEHPLVTSITEKFKNEISFRDNMDKQDNMDIFQQYSDGGIPTIVLGCKYYRVGSGEQDGKDVESKNLTALICKITGNKPEEVCNELKDIIDQIKS